MEPQINAWSLTVLSMITVFGVLGGLALLINVLKWFSVEKQNLEEPPLTAPEEVIPVVTAEDKGVAPEVIAAITAALAAYLDQGTTQLMVSAINRLAPSENWAQAGRLENISNRSHIRRSF
ncbi:MAG: OadG family protein [bacterium]|jgi:Na+-transporting methylmalonyl-CoA/oxaloacetate decarboxylase gamma subunit